MIQRIWAAALFVIGLTIFAMAVVIAYSPEAKADVSAACYAHLAKSSSHQTPAADRRFHLERGEESPCTEFDAGQVSTADDNHKDNSDDGKSRYCRKHIWC